MCKWKEIHPMGEQELGINSCQAKNVFSYHGSWYNAMYLKDRSMFSSMPMCYRQKCDGKNIGSNKNELGMEGDIYWVIIPLTMFKVSSNLTISFECKNMVNNPIGFTSQLDYLIFR